MSKKLYEEEHIQAIADSIREKSGTEDTFKVSEMSAAIQSLTSSQTKNNVFSYNEESIRDYIDDDYFTQIRYSKSNYDENTYPTIEDWLADESLICHAGDDIDTSKSLVAMASWPNENAYAAMACLAVNLNGAFLTDEFSTVKTEDSIYSISSDFQLNKEDGMEIDIVYTPDYTNLLFPPTFYRTDLYDNCNDTLSMDARVIGGGFEKLIYDEKIGKVKNPSTTQVTLYIDEYESLHKYTLKYISMLQKLIPELDWEKWDITQNPLFSMLLPCFVPEEFLKVTQNLEDSIEGKAQWRSPPERREDLYPFYVRASVKKGQLYSTGIDTSASNDKFDLDTWNYLTPSSLILYLMPMNDFNGWDQNYIEEKGWDFWESILYKTYSISTKLAKIEAVRYLCGEAAEVYGSDGLAFCCYNTFGWASPAIGSPLKNQYPHFSEKGIDHYDYVDRFYLPKNGEEEMRYYTFSSEDESQEGMAPLLYGQSPGTSDNFTTKDDNIFIVVPTTFVKMNDKVYYGEGGFIPPFCEAPFVPLPNVAIGG